MSDKIKILNINWVLDWSYIIDNCEICRLPLNNDTTKNVIIGKCKHMFHKECITTHLKNSKSCPIDMTLWIKEKELN